MKKSIVLLLTLTAITTFLTPTITNAQTTPSSSWCTTSGTTCCDESSRGTSGLVPCGRELSNSCTYTNPPTITNVPGGSAGRILTNSMLLGYSICVTGLQNACDALPNTTGNLVPEPSSSATGLTCTGICTVNVPPTTITTPGGNNTSLCSEVPPGSTNIREYGKTLTCRCELYHIFFLVMNVYKFVVTIIAVPLAGLLVLIGGALIILGGGYPKLLDTGKRILWGAVWGIILIFSSWLIINVFLLALGYNGVWYVFTF